MDGAQHCMANGDYIGAQMWTNHASSIDVSIDNLHF